MKFRPHILKLIVFYSILWAGLYSYGWNFKEHWSADGDVVIFTSVKYYNNFDSIGRVLWDSSGLTPDALFVPNVKDGEATVNYCVDSLNRFILRSAIQYGKESDKSFGIDGGIVIEKSNPAVVRWITDTTFELNATIEQFVPVFPDDIAGLLLYHDTENSILFGKSIDNSGRDCVKIIAIRDGILTHTATMMLNDPFSTVNLKITLEENGKFIFMAAENSDILRYVGIPISKFNTSEIYSGVMAGVYSRKKKCILSFNRL